MIYLQTPIIFPRSPNPGLYKQYPPFFAKICTLFVLGLYLFREAYSFPRAIRETKLSFRPFLFIVKLNV